MIRTRKSGDKVKLTMLQDDGKTIDRSITLSERPRDPGDQTYEVIYDQVVSNGIRHRMIVTKPKREGKHPVFFWIQGIGLGTVDFPLTANNGTAKILKSFSDDGFVTVRVEKTGLGDSEGGPADKVSYDAETDIFRQGVRAMDRYSFADRSQVYVFGHSMGGCHAPIIAADTPIKGIMSYGTVSDSWLEWQIKADRWQAILGGADPKQVDQDVRKTVTFYGELYNERKSVDQIVKDHPDLAEFARQQSPDGVNMSARSIDYMRGVNDKNFSDFWSRLGDCRVLALFGENDFVALESCQTQIPVIVNRLKPGHATFQKVKESDH
ncbi:MAG: alpha/beta hydrolase, partial [Fimbriimonadaceae bacterium]